MLALAETIPDVLAYAYPKLRRVAAFVDRTRAAQAVAAALELVQDAIVLTRRAERGGCGGSLEDELRPDEND